MAEGSHAETQHGRAQRLHGGCSLVVEGEQAGEDLLGGERVGPAVGEVAGLLPEIEQAAEGDVEEVSGAAGGVEDADGGEVVEEVGEEGFGLRVGG